MPSQVVIFYQPRSACRVMMRMVLDNQRNTDVYSDIFSEARGMQVEWLRGDNHEAGYPGERRPKLNEAIEKDVTVWRSRLEKDRAEIQNKMLVVQAYPFAPVAPERVLEYMRAIMSKDAPTSLQGENFSLIPDALLLHPGTVPVFVIRNPRVTVPSAFRVLKRMGIASAGGRPMAAMTTCNVWSRVLYDFYVGKGITPLVLDADDYLTSKDHVREICRRLDLDPAQAQFSWSAVSEEEKSKMHPMEFASAKELFESTSAHAARTVQHMQSELTRQHQEEEFGEDWALIQELVAYARPHHEYLWEKRMQV